MKIVTGPAPWAFTLCSVYTISLDTHNKTSGVGTVIIPILQMNKLRFREVA